MPWHPSINLLSSSEEISEREHRIAFSTFLLLFVDFDEQQLFSLVVVMAETQGITTSKPRPGGVSSGQGFGAGSKKHG